MHARDGHARCALAAARGGGSKPRNVVTKNAA
jgi:hypothetical protein